MLVRRQQRNRKQIGEGRGELPENLRPKQAVDVFWSWRDVTQSDKPE